MKLEYVVNESDDNITLKNILKKRLYISNTLLIKLKRSQSIYVNENIKHVNEIVHKNDIITVDLDNMNKTLIDENISFKDKFKLWNQKINILYEDNFLLIVDKNAGIPIHPCASEYNHTLANAVMNYLIVEDKEKYINENIHIITRLDKNTSGICVFAKNAYIQELFTTKKKYINFQKEYIAIVNEIVSEDHGIIEKNIARKANTIILRQVNENGDYAKTEYFVISRNYEKNYTILKVKIYTGRTHQIRVHMASIGHVLLGDDLYANDYNIQNITELISRQALHCHKIEFNHPITDKKIIIESNLPDDMKKLM